MEGLVISNYQDFPAHIVIGLGIPTNNLPFTRPPPLLDSQWNPLDQNNSIMI